MKDSAGPIPPLRTSPRYLALDYWRGLFCLLVVLEHAGVALWKGCAEGTGLEGWLRRAVVTVLHLNLGTPLFFVISGYCIAASVDSNRRKGASPLTFLARRLWRIFPPYWAALLGFVAVVGALDWAGLGQWHRTLYALELDSPRALDWSQWVGNLTLTETWRSHFWGARDGAIYTRVAWALCYQEQFYLLCFLVLLLVPRRLYGALAAVTAAVVAFRVVAWDAGMAFRIDGMFPMLWHEFAVGLAVYWRLNVAGTRGARRGVELGLIGLLAVGLASDLVSTVAAAGFGLALIGLRRFDDRIAAARWLDPVRALGRRSFSIYLTHLPVCVVGSAALAELGLTSYGARAFVTVPVLMAGSVAAGWTFDRWVDRWFHDLPKLPTPRMPSPREWLPRPIIGVAR
jgi:peptidoglycan/LPS O-acetylase OafA/YrhL